MICERIESAKNPKVIIWKSLKDRKARKENGCFIVEGRKMVEEALHDKSGRFTVKSLLVIEQCMQHIASSNIPDNIAVHILSSHVMEAVCDTKTPQGIAAVVAMPERNRIQSGYSLAVALDDVQDPGNVGTIIRTADAAGFDCVFMSADCADPFSPKVLRATMGSIFRITPVVCSSLVKTLSEQKKMGCTILSSQLDGSPFYERGCISEPLCLVIGNEGNGISEEIKAIADYRLKLPMRGGAESLNASVAAGIMMYDIANNI